MGRGGRFCSKKCSNRVRRAKGRISQLPEDELPQDRMSGLTDDLLVYILSFLTLKEAAQTSVLSSRWLNLWKYIPRLDFDAKDSLQRMWQDERNKRLRQRERHKYVSWVNHVLQLHQCLTVKEFRFCFDLDRFSISQDDIGRWIEYAFTRKVQKLELNLCRGVVRCDESVCCDFPDHLLNLINSLATEQPQLDCSGVQLPELNNNLRSLRSLSLKGVNITGEAVEFFLRNCPFLKTLVVGSSGKLVNLLVSGPSLSLKHLEISRCHAKSVKICNSNIVSLRISEVEELLLVNVPKLTEVFVIEPFYDNWSRVFSQFSCCLSQLRSFTLHTIYLETLSQTHAKAIEFPELSQLKHLQLCLGSWDNNSVVPSLTSLIAACPYLEKFVLKLTWMGNVKTSREKVKGEKCDLKYLKVIEFAGYRGCTADVELLMYLIENAVALEKIVIDHCDSKDKNAPITHAVKAVKELVPENVKLVIV